MSHIGFKDIPQGEIRDIKFHVERIPHVKPVSQVEEDPSLIDLMQNFYGFMKRFADKGLKTVSMEIYEQRTIICESCGYFDKNARGGLGRCNHADCGCTSLKRWFAFEKCPLGKWSEI